MLFSVCEYCMLHVLKLLHEAQIQLALNLRLYFGTAFYLLCVWSMKLGTGGCSGLPSSHGLDSYTRNPEPSGNKAHRSGRHKHAPEVLEEVLDALHPPAPLAPPTVKCELFK